MVLRAPSSFTAGRRPARYRDIMEHFRRRIEVGELRAGQVLQPHAVIAAQFGVSVEPVKHALYLLEMYGYVRCRQGGRTVVGTPEG